MPYSTEQTVDILDYIGDLEGRLANTTDKEEAIDLKQTINELYMHLQEN